MKTFVDNAGGTWTLAVNLDAIRRVRDLAKVNLLDVIEGKLIEQLVSDPVLLDKKGDRNLFPTNNRCGTRRVGSGNGTIRAGNGIIPAGEGMIRAGDGMIPAGNGIIPAGDGTIQAGNGIIPAGNGIIPAGNGMIRAGNGMVYCAVIGTLRRVGQ